MNKDLDISEELFAGHDGPARLPRHPLGPHHSLQEAEDEFSAREIFEYFSYCTLRILCHPEINTYILTVQYIVHVLCICRLFTSARGGEECLASRNSMYANI